MEKITDLMKVRIEKIDDLKKNNINLYPNGFIVSHTVEEIKDFVEKFLKSEEDSDKESGACKKEDTVFSTAGRMMAVNKFGKSSFIRFKDRTGLLQAYVRKDKIGDEAFALFSKLDVGDFITLSGTMFQTKTGEWTLLATSFSLLSKAVRPLPEKFHGLKDPEKRYRQRYLDLIMNSDTREIFIKRSKIIHALRNFLLKYDFLEVETPMMHSIAGGAEAKPFKTHHNALDMELFLRIAPELYLKRLVVGGFERVFEINRNFRNEGVSTRHNPEFTMVEFYQAYATYEDLMDLTEEMFLYITEKVSGSAIIEYQGETINFKEKWKRIPLLASLVEIGGVDKKILDNREALLEFAESKSIKIIKKERLGKILTKLFDELVEPNLIQPTFITGYPVEVSPLSRRSEEFPDLTDRFELFIAGREIANGFSELNDPVDQKDRFLQQVEDREAGNDEAHQMDNDYIEALEYGMPPTAGEGIGIDRLVMLLTNAASIREVILFPHMKNK